MITLSIPTIIILIILVAIAFYIGLKYGSHKKHLQWEQELPEHRKDAILRSRAVLGGHFSENLAPFLPNFPYLPNECTFIGKPIDFLVFKGSDEKNINEVIFVEVKSGNSKLSQHEKKLKEAIENKNVRWEEYRIPEELTKKEGLEFEDSGYAKDKKKKI